MNTCKICKHWRDQKHQHEYPDGYIIEEGHVGRCEAPKDADDLTITDSGKMSLWNFDGMSAVLYTTHDFYCGMFESR